MDRRPIEGLASPPGEGPLRAGSRQTSSGIRLVRTDPALRILVALWTIVLTAIWIGFFYLERSQGPLTRVADRDFTRLGAGTSILVVSVVFSLAVACAADAAIDGGAGVLQALRETRARIGAILAWAVLFIVGASLAWFALVRLTHVSAVGYLPLMLVIALLTFFVVPLIAVDGDDALSALRRSPNLFRRKPGQVITGLLSLGVLVFFGFVLGAIVTRVGVRRYDDSHSAGLAIYFAGVALIQLVQVFGYAAREAFAVILTREIYGDLPGAPADVPVRSRFRLSPKRIAIGVVVVVVALFVLGALLGPRHRGSTSASPPATVAHFETGFQGRKALRLEPGSPVEFRRIPVGTVGGTKIERPPGEGPIMRAAFDVDISWAPAVETGQIVVAEREGRSYLLVRPR